MFACQAYLWEIKVGALCVELEIDRLGVWVKRIF